MTTDLSIFGYVQQEEAAKMMIAIKNGWPDDFDLIDVKLYVDTDWGDVYFTNDSNQFAALTDSGKIESYYFSPTGMYKGFFDDLLGEYLQMNEENQEWFKDIASNIGRYDELPKLEETEDDE